MQGRDCVKLLYCESKLSGSPRPRTWWKCREPQEVSERYYIKWVTTSWTDGITWTSLGPGSCDCERFCPWICPGLKNLKFRSRLLRPGPELFCDSPHFIGPSLMQYIWPNPVFMRLWFRGFERPRQELSNANWQKIVKKSEWKIVTEKERNYKFIQKYRRAETEAETGSKRKRK